MDDFEKDFNQFKSMRMESIANTIIYGSEEYKKLMLDSDRLFTELCTYVKPEGRKLLIDYCNVVTLLQGIAESVMYEQGLRDGIKVLSAKIL
ncbi:hypothetical protein QE450_001013 [Paenibacillus sp. SORGH_AS306]|uniref:hypothetical protein n=1 Tax=unclassified Paenibacillus TaxID=185978 RepID=UPI0027876186|nr:MULTISPECIES: hypothetical protein [unclassified Paenibacillus]MDQ1233515.1 hypothetical protein [Paenibacillus sp. SORGH_AS_0306]MDR6110556.1 hypothetical protein [Paenibacillus sp. SORGH_AS_0338]